METYNNTLCISHAELTDGIISEANLMRLCKKEQVQRVRRGCYGTPALYAVDSLPTKYRMEVMRRQPDAKAQAEAQRFIDMVEIDGKAAEYYSTYLIEGARHLKEDVQNTYTMNASIMVAFRSLLSASDSERKKLNKRGVKRGEFWLKAAEALPRIADHYPHNLPENPRVLQRRYNEFFKDGEVHYEVFISGKYRNNNAAKIATDEQIAVVIRLMNDPRNLDNPQIVMFYNIIAEKMGWSKLTASALKLWRRKYNLETVAGRLGVKGFFNKRAMQVKRSTPTAPLYFWTLDGWDVELYYQKRNEKGVTTYSNRLTVVVVLDAFQEYPIGYAIGERECAQLITEALKNAVNHTAELFGQRYRANQIQSDHYAIKTMSPIYAACGEKFTPAKIGNAKAKPIERYFGRLNHTYCQLHPNWSGYGVTSDKDKQPNADWLNSKRHEFPDEAGVREQIARIITMERSQKVAEYVKGWENVADDRRLPMTTEQYLLTFGEQTGYKNALEGSGLNIRLLGMRRSYDCFDVEFRRHSDVRWSVKFDPNNLEEVLAVNEDGSLRFMLTEKYVQPMALADRKEGDAEKLAEVTEFNNHKLIPHVIEAQVESQRLVEQLFSNNPQLENTLSRSLLCDSNGQHKDRRNERRLKQAQVIEVQDAEYEDVPKHTNTFDYY